MPIHVLPMHVHLYANLITLKACLLNGCHPSGQAYICMQQYSNCAGWPCLWTYATAGVKCRTHGSSVVTTLAVLPLDSAPQ